MSSTTRGPARLLLDRRLAIMGSLRAPRSFAEQASGYAPEELQSLESELARLDVRELFGRLPMALEELAREREGA